MYKSHTCINYNAENENFQIPHTVSVMSQNFRQFLETNAHYCSYPFILYRKNLVEKYFMSIFGISNPTQSLVDFEGRFLSFREFVSSFDLLII